MERTVLEKVDEFKKKNPEIMSMLFANEMYEISRTENPFDMIATAFFLGCMKTSEKKGGAVWVKRSTSSRL